ncbi:23227_t:CDS:2 [Dentiscutata erythropus]|uniref:23227_t:CDS:1 n=1 Tax=Dentiscutata erythropus TaxID=1348616 RepID=A0A9N9BCU8_9GLOM|nr:23227_t:CDS:2 [Dentiscutata erythropus]
MTRKLKNDEIGIIVSNGKLAAESLKLLKRSMKCFYATHEVINDLIVSLEKTNIFASTHVEEMKQIIIENNERIFLLEQENKRLKEEYIRNLSSQPYFARQISTIRERHQLEIAQVCIFNISVTPTRSANSINTFQQIACFK